MQLGVDLEVQALRTGFWLGLLPLLALGLAGTEIERPLAIVMIGGVITSTLFTLPTFYLLVHRTQQRMSRHTSAQP